MERVREKTLKIAVSGEEAWSLGKEKDGGSRPARPPGGGATAGKAGEAKKDALGIETEHSREARESWREHEDDPRWQRERQEMQTTHDLDEVDDDVERGATVLEWRALEHTHRPKSGLWFAALAALTTVAVGAQLFFFANFIGALTLGLVGGLVYYVAQQKPAEMRYRIMLDGIALNRTFYHWQDLASFNVIYEPGEAKTVIFRSERRLSPYIHMEIGDADPVEIREVLLEFLPEDQDMEEPLVDILARRVGF